MTLPPKFPRCCIDGCARQIQWPKSALSHSGVCADHCQLASPEALNGLLRAQVRLLDLEAQLLNTDFFNSLVARGLYLKYCGLLSFASDLCDARLERVRRGVLQSLCGLTGDVVRAPRVEPERGRRE
jgi:hypothetical protein